MNITNYVMSDVRKFLNLGDDSNAFDGEIIPLVTSAIGKLSQNGVGSPKFVDSETTWVEVITPDMITNPDVFAMFPLYVMLSVKILFDPPPPSTIPYYQSMMDDNLWRLRIAYDIKGGDVNV